MSTAFPTQHRATHPTAMVAAAAAAVILGGASAVGFAMLQDGLDAPSGAGTTVSSHPSHPCSGPHCLSRAQHAHGGGSTAGRLPRTGGSMVPWLP
jgi:hypothetical protein